MPLTKEQIAAEIHNLPKRDQVELAEEILAENQTEIEEAQRIEIRRRYQTIVDGTAELIDGDTVDAEARAILNEKA